MLVILNPSRDSGTEPIDLADVRRTKLRRALLAEYVVVVIDTQTDHGRAVHRLFGSAALPRVAVIDKDQELQVYRTSEALYGQLWNQILETFRNADRNTRLQQQQFCPT